MISQLMDGQVRRIILSDVIVPEMAAMVLEPVTVPISEVSEAESLGPAVVVEENTVAPGVPPPALMVQSVRVALELSTQETPVPPKFRAGSCGKGVAASSTVW